MTYYYCLESDWWLHFSVVRTIEFYCVSPDPCSGSGYETNMQLYIPNLKKIGPVVHEVCVPENCPIFFIFFFTPFYRSNFEPTKDTFSWIDFSQIWHTYKALCGLKFKLNLRELWMIISLRMFKIFSHTYKINHWSYGLEVLSRDYPFIKSGPFWRNFKFDEMVNDHSSSCIS